MEYLLERRVSVERARLVRVRRGGVGALLVVRPLLLVLEVRQGGSRQRGGEGHLLQLVRVVPGLHGQVPLPVHLQRPRGYVLRGVGVPRAEAAPGTLGGNSTGYF